MTRQFIEEQLDRHGQILVTTDSFREAYLFECSVAAEFARFGDDSTEKMDMYLCKINQLLPDIGVEVHSMPNMTLILKRKKQ